MSSTVRLFLCGDVMTGRGIDQVLPHPGDPRIHEAYLTHAAGYVSLAEQANGPIPAPVDPAWIWGDALTALADWKPHCRIVNLETSITTSDDFWPGKGIHYRMNPANIDCLSCADIRCCALANNHVLDWGYRGLSDTLETLRRAGLPACGAGDTEAQAERAAVVSAGEVRVLVVSLGLASSGIPPAWEAGPDSPGINLWAPPFDTELTRLAHQLEGLRRPGDVLVVSVHWGGNWGYHIPDEQRRLAHRLVDEVGADIVHGHSAHHAKGIEVYRGRAVLYGCGDFINDYEGIDPVGSFRDDLALGFLADVDIGSGELSALRALPFRRCRLRLEWCGEADRVAMAALLDEQGRALGTGCRLSDDGVLALVW